MKSLTGWLIAYFFRWLPHSSPSGLFSIGRPDENSPVIVTANFSLTVKRVKKAIKTLNAWLLVANTEGINVWCAACGNIFTEHRIIDAIKVTGLAGKVSHREIILPALSAPGINRNVIRDETGFHARFGPVYAKDIPAYLEQGKKVTEKMQRFNFGFKHRLDMFIPMNFPLYLMVAVILVIFARQYLAQYSIIFWSAVGFLYTFLNVIPGKTGWGKSFLTATLVIIVWAAINWYLNGNPLLSWGWYIAVYGILFIAGFDISGTISPRESDAELFVRRLGIKSFGSLFSDREVGSVYLNRNRCKGCLSCKGLCPVGVFGNPDDDNKITFRNREECFTCGACIKQCPEEALFMAQR